MNSFEVVKLTDVSWYTDFDNLSVRCCQGVKLRTWPGAVRLRRGANVSLLGSLRWQSSPYHDLTNHAYIGASVTSTLNLTP